MTEIRTVTVPFNSHFPHFHEIGSNLVQPCSWYSPAQIKSLSSMFFRLFSTVQFLEQWPLLRRPYSQQQARWRVGLPQVCEFVSEDRGAFPLSPSEVLLGQRAPPPLAVKPYPAWVSLPHVSDTSDGRNSKMSLPIARGSKSHRRVIL